MFLYSSNGPVLQGELSVWMFLALERSQQRREDWDEANGEDRTNLKRRDELGYANVYPIAANTCARANYRGETVTVLRTWSSWCKFYQKLVSSLPCSLRLLFLPFWG